MIPCVVKLVCTDINRICDYMRPDLDQPVPKYCKETLPARGAFLFYWDELCTNNLLLVIVYCNVCFFPVSLSKLKFSLSLNSLIDILRGTRICLFIWESPTPTSIRIYSVKRGSLSVIFSARILLDIENGPLLAVCWAGYADGIICNDSPNKVAKQLIWLSPKPEWYILFENSCSYFYCVKVFADNLWPVLLDYHFFIIIRCMDTCRNQIRYQPIAWYKNKTPTRFQIW